VRKIREMKSSGILQRRIAEQFGISESVVSLIVRGKAWV
jgi:predicted XRE-type DNA-binding protein